MARGQARHADHAAGDGAPIGDDQRQLPELLSLLVAKVSNPVLVVDADDPALRVVAANGVARGEEARREFDASLASWLGDDVAAAARDTLARRLQVGGSGAWSWRLTTAEGRRWLLWERISEPVAGLAGTIRAPEDAAKRDRALIAAYEAALAVASELDLEAVLQRIVDLAREVVPARYAALGVANEHGEIEQFITSGITAEQRAAIGPLPRGHGLLGELIRERQPLLVPDMSKDPRSVGFPPHHPAMRSLLGAPILLGERVLGNLYLTERTDDQDFTEEDLETVQVLAAHAATAIDRAQLYRAVELNRRRAEEQRDQLRAILDNLPTGTLIQTPPDGRVELANAAAFDLIFGPGTPAGVLPVHGRDFRWVQADGVPLPNDLRPGIRALHQNVTVYNQQLLLERWDGQRVPVLAQSAPLYDAAGNVVRAVTVFQDVTRLREAEQLKDDFLSLISHEFRTPLTAIHGGAHLLANQGDALDEETRSELLADIVIESERLDRMLGNMLSLTSIMAGRLAANTEPVMVEPLARKVAAEVDARAPRHTLIIDVPGGLPPVEADVDLLAQVLRNLYENAVKYAPDGGEVRTTATADGESVTIRITDEGVGIAADQVGRVFERFHRAGADPTVRGMGLGLYLSRHLVESQGGTISAGSSGPGQGATFSVTLPVARGWQ